MAAKKIDFETVCRLAADLPGVERSTAYGSPALKVRGKFLCCIPTHKSAEPDSLSVAVGLDTRAELIEAAPETYYVKPHYMNYPIVLLRLARIEPEALRGLLLMAHRFASAKKR